MKLRRSDREMTAEQAWQLLQTGEYGILSTVDDQGQPYGTPLSYTVSGKALYFHCALAGHKLLNLQKNDKVCFTVVGHTQLLPDKFSTVYSSVIAFGKAVAVDEAEKIQALKELVLKYSPAFIAEGDVQIDKAQAATAVVRIDIENLTGKHRV